MAASARWLRPDVRARGESRMRCGPHPLRPSATSVLSRLVIVPGGWVGAFTALRKVALGVSEALVLRGGRSGASVRAVGSGAEPMWPGGLTV